MTPCNFIGSCRILLNHYNMDTSGVKPFQRFCPCMVLMITLAYSCSQWSITILITYMLSIRLAKCTFLLNAAFFQWLIFVFLFSAHLKYYVGYSPCNKLHEKSYWPSCAPCTLLINLMLNLCNGNLPKGKSCYNTYPQWRSLSPECTQDVYIWSRIHHCVGQLCC